MHLRILAASQKSGILQCACHRTCASMYLSGSNHDIAKRDSIQAPDRNNTYMYVDAYRRRHVRTTQEQEYKNTWMYAHTCMHIRLSDHVRTFRHGSRGYGMVTWSLTPMPTARRMYMYVCVYAYVYTHMYTYMCVYNNVPCRFMYDVTYIMAKRTSMKVWDTETWSLMRVPTTTRMLRGTRKMFIIEACKKINRHSAVSVVNQQTFSSHHWFDVKLQFSRWYAFNFVIC